MIRVLLIDDDRLALKGLRSLLPWEKYGMSVVGEALNGQLALEYMKTQTVDLVMVDLAMPVMDGLTFISKSKELFPEVEYVVMTFMEDFAYVQRALRLGVIDYISKLKLDEEDYDETFNRILERMKRNNESEHNSETSDILKKVLWLCDDLTFWQLKWQIASKPSAYIEYEAILDMALSFYKAEIGIAPPDVPHFLSIEMVLAFLEGFRKDVSEMLRTEEQLTKSAQMMKLGMSIAEDYKSHTQCGDIAVLSGFSRSYASSSFSKCFGITMNEFLRRKRIYESIILMGNNKKSLVDIGEEVGYESYQYYKKMFIEVMGQTPKDFRASMPLV